MAGDRYERGPDAYASQLGISREDVPGWFAERFGEREGQVRRLGVGGRVVGIRGLDLAPDELMTAMAPGPARDRLLERVEAEGAPLVAAEAETIAPAGGLPAVALPDATVARVPFLNGPAAAARAVRSAPPSTSAPPPAAAVEDVLAATGGPLTEPIRAP